MAEDALSGADAGPGAGALLGDAAEAAIAGLATGFGRMTRLLVRDAGGSGDVGKTAGVFGSGIVGLGQQTPGTTRFRKQTD